MYNCQQNEKEIQQKKDDPAFGFGQMMTASSELLHQIKIRAGLHDIYDISDASSTVGFALKTTAYFPIILWKMRKLDEIEPESFSYMNLKNETINGTIVGPKTDEALPLIALDSGYKTDLFNLSIVGKVIACLGYRTFSVRSNSELKVAEAEDYMKAMDYLRNEYKKKNTIAKKSAVVGISGGNIIVYKSCSSKEFVEKHSVKCAISIAPFADLSEQFKHMKDTLNKNNVPEKVRKVLEEYNEYVESLGVNDPSADLNLFKNASPITYCKDMLVKLLNIHGIKDKIVPATGSLKIHKEMERYGKSIETILTPGEGIHGDLTKWKKELIPTIGLGASIIYAYTFLKKHMKE